MPEMERPVRFRVRACIHANHRLAMTVTACASHLELLRKAAGTVQRTVSTNAIAILRIVDISKSNSQSTGAVTRKSLQDQWVSNERAAPSATSGTMVSDI